MPTRMKPLSRDSETGGVTAIVEYPPGFERSGGAYNTADEDIFYLSGEITVGGHQFGKYSYTFHPEGELRAPVRSESGVTFLASFSSKPDWHLSDTPGPQYEAARAVHYLDSLNTKWQNTRLVEFPAGSARKALRDDPKALQWVAVTGLLPQWVSPFTEWHTFSEEIFVLEGSITTTEGTMEPGAYLSHPPEDVHGPMHSTDGCLFFVLLRGPINNTYDPVDGYRIPIE